MVLLPLRFRFFGFFSLDDDITAPVIVTFVIMGYFRRSQMQRETADSRVFRSQALCLCCEFSPAEYMYTRAR